MKKTVIICRDPYDQTTWTTEQVDDVCAYLKQQFEVFPEFAKIYHGAVAESQDVTPRSEADIENIQQLEGTFYVVVYGGWLQLIYYAVVAIMAAYSVYTLLTMPKANNQVAGSGNNELQNRTNTARIKGRIPDIYGTIRAYPDLIANTYTRYINGVENEECLMAVGRGYYAVSDVRDADTDAEGISGMSVSVYDPGMSIIGTDTTYKTGTTFTDYPLSITKCASVNGQTLQSPNITAISDNTTLYFKTGGIIRSSNNSVNFTSYFSVGDGIEISGSTIGIANASIGGAIVTKTDGILVITSDDVVESLSSYQTLSLVGAVFTYTITTSTTTNGVTTTTTETVTSDLSGDYTIASATVATVNSKQVYTIQLTAYKQVNYNWNKITENGLSGTITFKDSSLGLNLDDTYSVSAVQSDQITLANASTVNSEWSKIATLYDGSTINYAPEVSLDVVNTQWVGWMEIYKSDATHIVFNIFFPQGLYGVNKKGKKQGLQIDIVFQYQQLSSTGLPIGTINEQRAHFDITAPDPFGRTFSFELPVVGSYRFRVAKINTDTPWPNNITESRLKDCYLTSAYDKDSYDGVTVVRTLQVATTGALSMKERKLNMLVTRKLKVDGTGALVATNDAGQALINLALDDYVGRRSSSEVDIDQVKAEIAKVKSYFGSSIASEFSYTFDDASLSFEEQAQMIASTCFCESYRYGNKIRLRFEQPQDTSTLLFNHRNKVPQSEKRTYTFGIQKDYDGIKLEYTDPDDDERVNYYLSYNSATGEVTEDNSATNPLEITTSGIRNAAVAKTRAWREWNKLQYQRVSVDFDALDESELLMRNDRVLVADNTVITTQDGEVVSQNGFTLTLSQNVEFKDGVDYYCFLQLSDGSTQSILCHPGEMTNEIILTESPRLPLVFDPDRYVKTLYTVVESSETDKQAFMLTEMSPNDQMTNKLTCINYDARYYEKDHTFI